MRHKRKSAFRSQIKDQFRLFVNVVHERSRNCFPFLVLQCNDSGVCCFFVGKKTEDAFIYDFEGCLLSVAIFVDSIIL